MSDKKIYSWDKIIVTPCYVENGKNVKLTDQSLPVVKEELKNDADVIFDRADCKFRYSFMFTRYEDDKMVLRSFDRSGTNQLFIKLGETIETPKVHISENGNEKDVYFELQLV